MKTTITKTRIYDEAYLTLGFISTTVGNGVRPECLKIMDAGTRGAESAAPPP